MAGGDVRVALYAFVLELQKVYDLFWLAIGDFFDDVMLDADFF